jgi:hypothetical protein
MHACWVAGMVLWDWRIRYSNKQTNNNRTPTQYVDAEIDGDYDFDHYT